MTNKTDLSEDLLKFAASIYIPALVQVCSERGYTHLTKEENIEKALAVIEKLRAKEAAYQKKVNQLAKQAVEAALDDEEE